MEYLKPIETLQNSVKHYQKILVCLTVLLGVSILAVPTIFKSGPYFVKDQESFFSVTKLEPWKLNEARVEGFTKLYLTSRYEWNNKNLKDKEKTLKSISSDAVFKKLKDLLSANQSLAQGQQAQSFFAFEGFAYSNKEQKIEAKVIKVLRIRDVAIATPLIVRLIYQQSGVSELNPYGMNLVGLEELEERGQDMKGTHE